MKPFTVASLAVCMLLYTVFGLWLITRCNHWFTGLMTTLFIIGGAYGIYRAAVYIALVIIWGIRFAAAFAVYAFILFGFPFKRRTLSSG